MCQAKRPASPQRPRKTAAEAQAEAIADVERIAKDLYATLEKVTGGEPALYEKFAEENRERYGAVVRDMLQRDVIRVGQRPVVEETMPGQVSIDDLGSTRIRICDHAWEVGQDFCVKGCGTSYEQLYRRHNSQL